MAEVDACPDDEVLAAHLAGEADVGAHLDSCDTCRAVVGVMVKVDETVAGTKKRKKPGVSAGRMIDRYRVDTQLGAGGMGIVYRAHDTELGRDVALKVMRPELGGAAFADRLLRESRLMALVSHPSVIAVFDVGRHHEQVWVAMELIEGGTLNGWLRGGKRGWKEIVEVFRRAGEGLAAAHRAGLVHRDFKPDNVLLGDQRVVVTDFGVARVAEEDEAPGTATRTAPHGRAVPPEHRTELAGTPIHASLTATGVAVGTPAYMAPEQLEARRVDARADVFAFSVALWEALWGARPFPGRSVAEIRAAMARGVPPAPGGAVPRWVGDAVRAGLAIDPARRTRTIEELIARLDPRRHARRVRLAAATAIGAVVLGGGAIAAAISFSGGGAAKPTPAAATGPALCGTAEPGLAQVWTDVARADVRDVVVSTGNPVGARIAERAIAGADAWARRWDAVRTQVCAGAARDPLAPAEAACLEVRRQELAALIEVMPQLGKEELTQLDLTMASLSNVEVCGTPAAQGVAGEIDAPPAVLAVRESLYLIDASRLAGDTANALAGLDALRPELERLAMPDLTAQFLLVESRVAPERAIDALRTAAAEAEKARADDLAAQIWIELAAAYTDVGDHERADETLVHADAAITRAGDSPLYRVDWTYERARLRAVQDRLDEALDGFRAALALAEKEAPHRVTQIELGLADVLEDRGRFEDALAINRRVAAERAGQYGDDHILVADAATAVASNLLMLGQTDGALAELEKAAAIAERAYGPDSLPAGMNRLNLAEAMRTSGRYAESLAMHERAEATLVAAGADDATLAFARTNRAGALIGLGRLDEAVDMLVGAIGTYEQLLGAEASETARCRLNLAEALRKNALADLALDEAEHALESLRTIHGDDHPYVAYARTERGKALLALRRQREAVAELEAALRIYEGSEMDPAIIADARFTLARALDKGTRAVDLARAALLAFDGGAGEWTDEAAEARAWLAKRR